MSKSTLAGPAAPAVVTLDPKPLKKTVLAVPEFDSVTLTPRDPSLAARVCMTAGQVAVGTEHPTVQSEVAVETNCTRAFRITASARAS
ncbi:MAG: hypothetical protein JNN31_08255 [Dechloromonas sp.]|nr:hypothetical protein [Dechloromonas sp.]